MDVKTTMWVNFVIWVGLAGAALANSQTTAGQTAPPQDAPAAAPVPRAAQSATPAADDAKTAGAKPAAADSFVIGPEDVLYIRVMHEPDLTGMQDVRPDGMISMQLVGDVKAAGLTPVQLGDAIREKLTATIRNPEVSVQLSKVNSRKYVLQGEVNRPGTYTFSTPITVLEALVAGMGFRDFANVKKIYVLRREKRLPFNYKDVSRGKHMEQNIVVENGDQIFVP